MNRNGILQLLGLARKANKIIIGGDRILELIKKQKILIVFIGKDSSMNTIKRFENKCFHYKIAISKEFTSEELSKAVGKAMCKVLGVADRSFYNIIAKQLNGGIT